MIYCFTERYLRNILYSYINGAIDLWKKNQEYH